MKLKRAASIASTLLAAFLVVPSQGRAEHARISLDVSGPTEKTTAFVDQTPPPSGKNDRPVLKVKAGDLIKIQYILVNVYPHKTLKDVVVYFYVAKINEVGQKELPNVDSGDGPVLESAFEMDFQPGGKAGARAKLRIDEPGVYLVRVETRNTQSDHEHFSAVDLVVEK